MSDDRWRGGPAGAGYGPAAEELAELRELLLGAERQRIRELERRLDAAGLTGEELAELLPEAIVLRARRDRQLARALAPTIEGALSESVRRNPREIATAIFPVLGPAIRKAIAEALAGLVASINHALEHSLSPRGIAWRIEGWRTGVPYAQIVLRHALIYRVEQLFLIHGETGLLLAQAASPDRPATDADLVSGMLTAIRDFVGDAFGPEREAGGLRRFSVGELTVLVEQGPMAVLAAVVRGQAPDALHARLQETLESIHLQFGDQLAGFDGDPAPFATAVPLLEECLETQLSTDRRDGAAGRRVWLPWAVAAVAVFLLAGWLLVRSNREWQRALAQLRAEPGLMLVSAERDWGRWRLTGLRDPLAADPNVILASAGIDTGRIRARWEPFLSAHPDFIRMRAQQRSPSTELAALERSIESERVLFAVGSASLAPAGVGVVERVAAAAGRLAAAAGPQGARVRVVLLGRSDPTGSNAANAALSRLRGESVRAALVERGVDPTALELQALGATSPLAPDVASERSTINRSVSFEVRVE